jgi:tetratricopeptide (TPR) repeat protein
MTAITDIHGYELTTGAFAAGLDADAVRVQEGWERVTADLLGHKFTTRENIDGVLQQVPDFAFGWAVRGIMGLLMGCGRALPGAREAYQKARKAERVSGATLREAAVVDALGLLLDGRWRAGADRIDQALHMSPGDAMLVKLSHAVRFILGDAAGMRRSIESVLEHFDAGHLYAGYVYGCYAFALEETGAYAEAEARGREGLAINRDDCWGLHAVTHVYEMQLKPDQGERWLLGNREAWASCNNFQTHVWWHLALMYLEQGDHERVLALYDNEIRAEQTDDYRDIANGASMLLRLELEGVEVGGRWCELADKAAGRLADPNFAFADLHYLISLLACGRQDEAEALAARIARMADGGQGDPGVIARKAGQPTAEAILAFYRGDYRAAIDSFAPADRELYRIGGSHAQRDVFKRLMTEAALRAGQADMAQRLLNDRISIRGGRDHFAEIRLDRLAALKEGKSGRAGNPFSAATL